MKDKILAILKLIPKSLKDLKDKNPLQLASSTAFFSLFAIPPILVILINTLGLFIKPEFLNDEIFSQISNVLGNSGTEEIKQIFRNFQELPDDLLTSILVFLFLLFIGTNLFFLVQLNINQVWDVPSKSNQKFTSHLRGRLTAIALVSIGGVIILIAILSDIVIAFIGDHLTDLIPNVKSYLVRIFSIVFSLLTFSAWFTLLFKILPNAKLPWKPAIFGGVMTSVLFKIGQIVIEQILVNSNIKGIFGASSSIVLVMLFIFYVSFIFYFVAMFIKNYSDLIDQPITTIKKSKNSNSIKKLI
ncbi:YihY/virulence factor BrkB family protein [Marivirga salinae]|uniref:YihY/virulence factor BrkB family protein n=1 Tax=Marivirga salinarum TaxID=3059078 RepID=A0AA49GF00_9BACT|nr:YihY/virulence factor BrkB family protein [Marivirga sp. BDSF4-3]WKK78531.2 YihY/virulence factor BrkB family protein [Marivirga sp. BDSF4-3]